MTDNEFLKKFQNLMGLMKNQSETPAPAVPQNNNTDSNSREAILAEERQRVANLEAMKNGNPAVDAIIETAKANGATADSVKPYVDAIPQENAPQNTEQKNAFEQFLNMFKDNMGSGADGVMPTPQGGTKNEAVQKAANIEEVAGYANKIMEVK